MPARLDRRLLARVTDLFDSSHDGEKLAALAAAGRLLTAGGATWRDLVEGSDEAEERDDHEAAISELLLDAGEKISPWERSFLISCAGFVRLSSKQTTIVKRIAARVARGDA